jgi:hypothetical protein
VLYSLELCTQLYGRTTTSTAVDLY